MGRNLGPLNIKDSYEGLVQISGSLLTDGSGSLISNLEVTASYATTASYAENSPADSLTLSQVLSNGNVGGGGQTIILSGSGIETRTFSTDAITSGIAGGDFTIQGGSVSAGLVLTGNGNTTNIIKINESGGIQISGSVSSLNDITAPTFSGSLYGNALTSTSSSHSDISDFAFTATSASYAITATLALSASHANNSDTAISSSYAFTASYADNAGASTLQEVLDNSNTATGVDIILTGSYLRHSASFSGNVIDNLTTPTSSEAINHLVYLTQAEYNALTPDDNTLYVISGSSVIAPSTLQEVLNAGNTATGSIDLLGSIKATSFTGSLQGNATTATSASYAITASYAENAGSPFPYTGSAEITGSLGITGSLSISGSYSQNVSTGGRNITVIGSGGANNKLIYATQRQVQIGCGMFGVAGTINETTGQFVCDSVDTPGGQMVTTISSLEFHT
jgi:hypothetical protein